MKKKRQNEEDARIKEFLGELVEFELSRIPKEEVLRRRYRLSDLFYQRMENLIHRQERKAKRRNFVRGIGSAAAVFFLILLLTNPEFVANAANRVFQWFYNHISFQFKENTDVNQVPRYRIGYVPEGYELQMDEYYTGAGVIEYFDKNGNGIDFFYGVIDSVMNVDNENKELLILKGKGKQKIYYLKGIGDDSSITWSSDDETTVFNLSGILTEEELLKIYESIEIVE